ncbi:MAG: aminopeptidase P family protein [Oscillospiraceae bacterium]|nr:aminopeptidase P family protein [Oscillospiraceae bacterium]
MKLLTKEKDIRTIRNQFETCDAILKDRLENLMPQILKECGVDMWMVVSREYNEDPVFWSLVPKHVKFASRTSCFLFCLDEKGNYEALNLSRPDPRLSPYYKHCYTTNENQFEVIARVIKERNPKKIAVNVAKNCAQADGMTKYLWDTFTQHLGDVLVPDEDVAIRWLETRTQAEIDLYPEIYRISMDILREAYSLDVITPGVTTTTDVEYYIMQRMNDMGVKAWFAPDVDVQRKGCEGKRMSNEVIQKGDIIHTDWGIEYMGLHTDSQRLGYILRDGETEIPAGILAGFKRGNRFQDIVRESMVEGKTGNDIYFAAMEKAQAEGLRPMLYTHPIGFYGHGAGPLIGLYGRPGFVEGMGEKVFHNNTCYALELNVEEPIPEWDNQVVAFYMEETITFKDGKTYFNDDCRDVMIKIG